MLSDFGQGALDIKSHLIYIAARWTKSNCPHFPSEEIEAPKN